MDLRIVVVGDIESGKTSLINRFCDNTFSGWIRPPTTIKRILIDVPKYKTTRISHTGSVWYESYSDEVKFIIQEDFCVMRAMDKVEKNELLPRTHVNLDESSRHCHAIIITYDCTSEISFTNAEIAARSLKEEYRERKFYALVATKCDLVVKKFIDTSRAERLANELGMIFFETSAKQKTNIDELFSAIALKAMAPKLTGQEIDAKKQLIQQRIDQLRAELKGTFHFNLSRKQAKIAALQILKNQFPFHNLAEFNLFRAANRILDEGKGISRTSQLLNDLQIFLNDWYATRSRTPF